MFWVEKIEKIISGGTSIRNSRVSTKVRLKMTLFSFWIKLTGKRYFRTKKNENYHQILYIQINLVRFQLQLKILIYGTDFQKTYTSSRKHKK